MTQPPPRPAPAAPLWTPSPERVRKTHLDRFRRHVERAHGVALPDYETLWRWSVERPEDFWREVWDLAGIVGERGATVVRDRERMPGARWFPDARLNFAENLLRSRDHAPALVFRGEHGQRRQLSGRELYDQVSRLRLAFEASGLRPGERVAAWLPNVPEAVAAMLATTSLGAVFTSCSPDFGVAGVLDRFGQVEPSLLVAVDGYYYGGKRHDVLPKLAEVVAALPSVRRTVVVPYAGGTGSLAAMRDAVWLDDFLAGHPPGEIDFPALPFDHPLYVLYSSGTTGPPKCIVHGAGGTLLQHAKEHLLHCDLHPGDRLFYFTTLGWMMWNWLVSGLASRATLQLYDGSPFQPGPGALFDYAAAERTTHLGVSAKFIDGARKAGLEPARTHDLSSLRVLLSTGSPLAPEGFDWVYEHVKRDVQLASISGGTDIVSCFVAGDPTGPVHRGEIQARALGLAVDVFDEAGRPVRGEKGELVCTQSFPSMPLGFWNDPGGARYRAAYFERFPGVWCHGDFVDLTAHGGVVVYGRSDAVLNPGGVRIGTAEIYRQVEGLEAVEEAIVVGQDWEGDVRVVLFVRLRPGHSLDDALRDEIRARIRRNASPRHVPARILQVPDIPRTRSGKIVELAVREVLHGREPRNVEALANPEALDHFAGREELAS